MSLLLIFIYAISTYLHLISREISILGSFWCHVSCWCLPSHSSSRKFRQASWASLNLAHVDLVTRGVGRGEFDWTPFWKDHLSDKSLTLLLCSEGDELRSRGIRVKSLPLTCGWGLRKRFGDLYLMSTCSSRSIQEKWHKQVYCLTNHYSL